MDDLQKAKRVLVSQGRAASLAESSLSKYVKQLAEMCGNDGNVKAGTPERFAALWYEHLDSLESLKATDSELDEPTEVDAD